jgi:tRNA pseudouridine55 synthase
VSLSGILLLDKSLGLSSNSALQKAKRLINASKAGHTGSLDPLASGMLPLCFGEATKFSRFMLEADKCYSTVMCLGMTTSTGDSEGEILTHQALLPEHVCENKFAAMIAQFQGEQFQTPPMYSALKHQGQPLYKLARQGRSIHREARKIIISQLILEGIEHQQHAVFGEQTLLTLRVQCSKGTYIRTLVEDMGAYLGCGAHVSALRRLWAAPFTDDIQHPMITLDELGALTLVERHQSLLSIHSVLSKILPTVSLNSDEALELLQGKVVALKSEEKNEEINHKGWVSLSTAQGVFLGVGERGENNTIAPRRLVHVHSVQNLL